MAASDPARGDLITHTMTVHAHRTHRGTATLHGTVERPQGGRLPAREAD